MQLSTRTYSSETSNLVSTLFLTISLSYFFSLSLISCYILYSWFSSLYFYFASSFLSFYLSFVLHLNSTFISQGSLGANYLLLPSAFLPPHKPLETHFHLAFPSPVLPSCTLPTIVAAVLICSSSKSRTNPHQSGCEPFHNSYYCCCYYSRLTRTLVVVVVANQVWQSAVKRHFVYVRAHARAVWLPLLWVLSIKIVVKRERKFACVVCRQLHMELLVGPAYLVGGHETATWWPSVITILIPRTTPLAGLIDVYIYKKYLLEAGKGQLFTKDWNVVTGARGLLVHCLLLFFLVD